MHIRAATPADAETLFTLYVDGWQTNYQQIVAADFLAKLPENRRSYDYLLSLLGPQRADAVVLLAEEDDTACGFVAAGHTRDSTLPHLAELYAVYVAQSFLAKGAGFRLFQATLPILQARGFKQLHVWTFAQNKRAQQAYQRWGGQPQAQTRTVAVAGAEIPEVGFIWPLTASTGA